MLTCKPFCKEVNQNNLADLLPELGCYTIHWADECQYRNQPGCEYGITAVNNENCLLDHVIRAHEEAKIPGEVLVLQAREVFYNELSPSKKHAKWRRSFWQVLLDEGYIREGLTPANTQATFAVYRLYQMVYHDLSEASQLICSKDALFSSNQAYENFVVLSDREVSRVMEVLKRFPEKYFDCLDLFFGIDIREPWKFSQIARSLDIRPSEVRKIIDQALRAMRNDERYQLPPLSSITQVLPRETFRAPDSNEQFYKITNFIELTPAFESVSQNYEFKNPSDFVHQYYKSPMKEVM